MSENDKLEGESGVKEGAKCERAEGELRAPPRRRKSARKQRVTQDLDTKTQECEENEAVKASENNTSLDTTASSTSEEANINEETNLNEGQVTNTKESHVNLPLGNLTEKIESAPSLGDEMRISLSENENISDIKDDADAKPKFDEGNSHDFHKEDETSRNSQVEDTVCSPQESVNDLKDCDMGLKCASLHQSQLETDSQNEGMLSTDKIQNWKSSDSGIVAECASKDVETFCWVDASNISPSDNRTIVDLIGVNDDNNDGASDTQGTESLPYQRLENTEIELISSGKSDDDDEGEFSTAAESDLESFYSDYTSSEGEYNMQDAEKLFGVGNFIDTNESYEDNDQATGGVDTVKEILSVFPSTEYLSVKDDSDEPLLAEDNDSLPNGNLNDSNHGDSTFDNFGLDSQERVRSLERKIGKFEIIRQAQLAQSEKIRQATVRRYSSLMRERKRTALLRKVSEEGIDLEDSEELSPEDVFGNVGDADVVECRSYPGSGRQEVLDSSPRHGSYSGRHEKEGNLEISRERFVDGSPRCRSRSEGDIYELDFEEHQKYSTAFPRRSQSSKAIDLVNVMDFLTHLRENTFDKGHSDSVDDEDEDRTLVAENESLNETVVQDSDQIKEDVLSQRPDICVSTPKVEIKLQESISTEKVAQHETIDILEDFTRTLSIVKEETASLLDLDMSPVLKTHGDFTSMEHTSRLDNKGLLPPESTNEESTNKEPNGEFESPNRVVSPLKVSFEGEVGKETHRGSTSSMESIRNDSKILNTEDHTTAKKEPLISRQKSAPSNLINRGGDAISGDGNNNDNHVVMRKKKKPLRRKWLSFSMVETSSNNFAHEDDKVQLKSYRKKKGSTDEPDVKSLGRSPEKGVGGVHGGDDTKGGAAEGRTGVEGAAGKAEEAVEEGEGESSPERPPRKAKLGHSRSFNTPAERKRAVKRSKKVRAERSFRWQTLSGGIDVTAAELFRISRLSAYKPVELVHDGPVTLVTDALAAMFPNFPTDKRSQVALELYTTERTYVRGLETIMELFKTPLEDYLDAKEMKTMFSNISSIFQLNKDMVFSLCERITHWKEEQCIGDIFSEMAPRFKIYATFCNNYDAAENLIKSKIKRRKEFESFLNMCYSDPVCQPGLTLQAYLITVVQRIPRYLLLLRDLLKSTSSHHPDHRHLKDALQKMHNIAEYINNQLQAVQGQRAMAELRSRVIGIKAFETQGRSLIKEGEISLMSVKKTYKCLLFNDMLVYAATNEAKQSEVELTLELKTLWVNDLDDNDPQTSKEDAIEVYTPERSYVMYTGSRNEKKHWLQKLRTAIAIQLHGDEATDTLDITYRKAAFTYKDGRIYCGSFEDGKRHGEGVLAWQNRTRYEGRFEDDERNGIGVLTYNTGERYRGQWEDDKQSGVGTLTYPNGDYYHGEWRDGKMHGKGIIEFNNKDILNGEFVDGDIQGEASLKCSNGMNYQGSWKNSKKHGKGELIMANGDTYSGDFFNDNMHGCGEMKYAKQGATYSGQWENSQRHGIGTYKLPDGTIYEGEWSGDHIQGRGRMEYPDKDSYDGTWFRNMRFGKGVYRYHEGVYEGQFEYDLRHGFGIMKYSDGSEYEGHWQNDQRHGQGKMIYADQSTYEGMWFHNLRHGKGKMEYHSGAVYDGTWELDSEHGSDGSYTDVSSHYAYRGEWLHGRREGRGVETTAHSAYEGEFKANMRHGRGQETLKCGTVYEGRWKEDRKCGEGTRKVLNAAPEIQHWKDGHLIEKEETVAPDLPLLQRR